MDYSWAKPGVKVVYVLAGKLAESSVGACPLWEPQVGETYTIRSVEVCRGHLGLELDEQWEANWLYSVRRFRPLISQADDLALFTHLLDGQPIRETA